jgi:hypothetical protein
MKHAVNFLYREQDLPHLTVVLYKGRLTSGGKAVVNLGCGVCVLCN